MQCTIPKQRSVVMHVPTEILVRCMINVSTRSKNLYMCSFQFPTSTGNDFTAEKALEIEVHVEQGAPYLCFYKARPTLFPQ